MQLNIATNPNALPPKPTQHEKLVQQTRKWVGLSFFAPILDEMRNSPFASKMLNGGEGGKAFAQLYDQELSQRMSRGAGSKLVNSIVNRIEAKKAYASQKSGGANVAAGR